MPDASQPHGGAPSPDQAAQAAREPVGLVVCASRALQERGQAHVWPVQMNGEPVNAFALRIDGRVVAYVNRCRHVDAEMDWNPGEFLDDEGQSILCSLHGARYEPVNGRCIGGPCGRQSLIAVTVREQDGMVAWYPDDRLQPESAR